MTLATPAAPSSVHILHPGSAAMRILFRALTLGTLVLAVGRITPVWAATDGPAPRPLADTLSVTLAPPAGGSVTEGDTARFTVAVKGKAGSGDVTVRYAVSGTATAGEDYVAPSGEVTLSGGARTATIDLAVVADSIADGGETVTLTLTDGTGPAAVVVDATPATVTITDARDLRNNQGPEADAGTDQTVDERTLVNLDGSGSSDPEDDPLTFSWTQTAGPDVELEGADSEYASFTAPEVDGDSTLTFRLTVTDTHRNSSSASTNVTVRDVNAPPVCGSLIPPTIHRGESGSAACTDPEGAGPVTHTVLESPSVVNVTGGTSVTWTGVSLGRGPVRVRATDADGEVTDTRFVVTVVNEPPVCADTVELHRGESRTVDLGSICSDPDGLDPSGFGAGESSNSGVATASFSGTVVTIRAKALGSTNVPVTATDNLGLEGSGSIAVNVVNERPDCTETVQLHRGETTTVDLGSICSDPDGLDPSGFGGGDSSDPGVATSSRTGTSVRITGVSLGGTTVPVTATDNLGLEGGGNIVVNVVNERPVCTETVELHRGESRTVDLGSICSDPDGLDPSGFGGGDSSDPGVATSSRTGTSVRITGVSLGGTTVPVTATDNLGLEGGGNIVVNVVNERPVCTETVELHRGESRTVDLGSICSDPDGLDPTGFGGGASSDPGIARSSRTGASVRITGVSLGGTTVPVTATDNLGLEGGGNIVVNVVNERPDCTETVQLHRGESRTVDLGACAAGTRRKPSDAARGVSRAEAWVVFRTGTRCWRGDGRAGGRRAGSRTSFDAPGDA